MNWKTVNQPASESLVLELGSSSVQISVLPDKHDCDVKFQHMLITVCEQTQRSCSECLEKWPLEAIALARKELEKIEAELETT